MKFEYMIIGVLAFLITGIISLVVIDQDQISTESIEESVFRQNDFNCFTYWDATLSYEVDYKTLEELIRNEITLLGSTYIQQDRNIVIESVDDNQVKIGIQGCWGWPESNEPDLQMAIRNLEEVEEIS